MGVSATSITPFLFFEKETSLKDLSNTEKSFIKLVEKLQIHLIQTKAKNLRRYV